MTASHFAEIEELFQKAIQLVKNAPPRPPSGPAQLLHPPYHVQLELYGLYKQATSSQNFPPVSNSSDTVLRQRWEAWGRCVTLNSQECRLRYLATIYPILYRWSSLPLRTLTWYFSTLSPPERLDAESSLSECRELVELLDTQPVIMNMIGFSPHSEPFLEEDIGDETSEFSFEELFLPNQEHGFLSSEEELSLGDLRFHQPVLGADARNSRRRSYSTISANSAEFAPTVPFTPNFEPSSGRGVSRRLSAVSVTPFSLQSQNPTPQRSRAHSGASQTDYFSLRPRTRSGSIGNRAAPPLLRDETSALIQSTSQRLGQGMALVRKSLQRLERLEEKVDGALHRKLQPSLPRPSPTRHPPLDASLSSWITKMYQTFLH